MTLNVRVTVWLIAIRQSDSQKSDGTGAKRRGREAVWLKRAIGCLAVRRQTVQTSEVRRNRRKAPDRSDSLKSDSLTSRATTRKHASDCNLNPISLTSRATTRKHASDTNRVHSCVDVRRSDN